MLNDSQTYLCCADCGEFVNSSEEMAHTCSTRKKKKGPPPGPPSGHVDAFGTPLFIGDEVIFPSGYKKKTLAKGRVVNLSRCKATILDNQFKGDDDMTYSDIVWYRLVVKV
jgi:hypothetical protein